MHAIHPDPRLVRAALLALVLALVALAAAPTLGGVELGGGAPVPSEPEAVEGRMPPPAWAEDPMAPPALLR